MVRCMCVLILFAFRSSVAAKSGRVWHVDVGVDVRVWLVRSRIAVNSCPSCCDDGCDALPRQARPALVEVPWYAAATLAPAAAPCWALETDRILLESECGLCPCSSSWFSGPGMGVPLDCLVSPCAPGGFWIETDFYVFSMTFLVDDCSSCFQGERIKLIEALSLLIDGYVFSSQVMYGIQEAAAACLLVAFARLVVLFVGWQPQPAACMIAGMLALSCVRKFMKLRGLFGSVSEGLFAFGCFFVWEGESLLAGNSPAGTGEQATGRVDVPGEKQIVASAAAAAASSCAPPQVKMETETWQVLVSTLTGRSVALQVSNSISRHRLDCLLAERVGVPVGSFHVLRNGRVWLRLVCRGWMLCGWLGACLVVLVSHLSLFRASGRARRVVWRDAGQIKCGAFGAWLHVLL